MQIENYAKYDFIFLVPIFDFFGADFVFGSNSEFLESSFEFYRAKICSADFECFAAAFNIILKKMIFNTVECQLLSRDQSDVVRIKFLGT